MKEGASGTLVSGTVRASNGKGIFVNVGTRVGRLKLSDISTRFISGDEVAKLYPVGSTISDLVISSITADKKLELRLKTRIGEPELGSVHKVVVKRVEKYGVIFGFPDSMMRCLCETEEVHDELESCKPELAKIQAGHKFNVRVIKVQNGKVWVTMKKSQLGDLATYAQPVMEFADPKIQDAEEDVGMAVFSSRPKTKLVDDGETPKVSKKMKPMAADALEVSEDENGEKKRKKSKRQKDAARRAAETTVREKEEALLSGDWKRDPQSAEEFERLLVVNKSAGTWIKYMSFWLKMAEVGKAREVAERAVKHTELAEQEKLNLWIAYLNMEAAFGSEPAVESVFVRAAQYCDAKKVHHALPQVWVRAGNVEKAKTAFERVTAKFHESRKAWLNLVEFFFNQQRFDEARAAYAKCLKAVPARKQARVTVKFAQLEFRHGNPERGASVFESLLSNKAAKTDVWSVFFDEQIKAFTPPVRHAVDFGSIRALFERALSTKLKAFKMKFFFKRWLDFETKFGDDDSVEVVKQRAVEYVESTMVA